MIYYKITDHAKGSLLTTTFSVNYSQYHWVRGIGKLFVFDSLESVHKFRNPIGCTKIMYPVWMCEVRKPEILIVMAKYTEDYERFWKSFPKISSDIHTTETPAGTIAVSTLKLLERVC